MSNGQVARDSDPNSVLEIDLYPHKKRRKSKDLIGNRIASASAGLARR